MSQLNSPKSRSGTTGDNENLAKSAAKPGEHRADTNKEADRHHHRAEVETEGDTRNRHFAKEQRGNSAEAITQRRPDSGEAHGGKELHAHLAARVANLQGFACRLTNREFQFLLFDELAAEIAAADEAQDHAGEGDKEHLPERYIAQAQHPDAGNGECETAGDHGAC